MNLEKSILGCLLGTAVGDAIGLPCEGLSKQRQQRIYPDLSTYHLIFGRGMVSDDTEHACLTAQALLVSGGETAPFRSCLARQLRWWLTGLPAGIGLATLRSLIRLWFGVSPERSGVYSAGNGSAMRSPIIGVCYGHDLDRLRDLVRASTCMTHSDPKALFGALAVAWAAYLASTNPNRDITPQEYTQSVTPLLGAEAKELTGLIERVASSVQAGETTEAFASQLGLGKGVTGYIYHTVPVVLHAWLRHQQNYREAILEIIRCGGDTDTTAAILGGIVGARVGKEGIPQEWLAGLCEWPRNINWIEQLGRRLAQANASGIKQPPSGISTPALLLRNFCFMLIVLAHGFRRLLPPY